MQKLINFWLVNTNLTILKSFDKILVSLLFLFDVHIKNQERIHQLISTVLQTNVDYPVYQLHEIIVQFPSLK